MPSSAPSVSSWMVDRETTIADPGSAPRPDASTAVPLSDLDDAHGTLVLELEWLVQVVSSVPTDPSLGLARYALDRHISDLVALKRALDRILDDACAPRIARRLSPLSPIGAYVRCVYATTTNLTRQLERLACALRGDPVTFVAFHLERVAREFERLEKLGRNLARTSRPPTSSDAAAALDATLEHHVEELSWAAAWTHIGLARHLGT